jgi:hypothetical protein
MTMLSNRERGWLFQLRSRDALKQVLGREVDLEVRVNIRGNTLHSFDLATRERDIFAECKAMTFTCTGNNPQAKLTAMREACSDLRAIPADIHRLLILLYAPHPNPKRGETLGQYFVRLNSDHLDGVTVLEMPERGGELVCIHGGWPPPTGVPKQGVAAQLRIRANRLK